ncbi:MAG: glycosyltransferase [Burkholderiaceae bacterium]|nr:glycosyltransferase [Burkholderiaceae bacterium]
MTGTKLGTKACRVLMIGPPLDGRGGMSSVSAAYRDAGLFERCGVRYLSSVTARSGAMVKLWVAIGAWLELVGLLLSRQVDLAHIHVASGASFWRKAIYLWTLRMAGVQVVLHVHGGNFLEFFRTTSRLGQRYIRASFAQCGRVILLSRAWVDRIGVVVDPSRCRAIGNPVLAWPQQRTPRPIRTFLFLGRFERDKGIHELLEAFAKVRRQVPDVKLLLGGDGDTSLIERAVAQHDMAQDVTRLGWVSGETKRNAFAAADALVLPSYVEALPVAMLEAMSCGLPVVVSNVGSIPEVISDGVNGLLVAPRDIDALAQAMLALALKPDLALQLGKEGKATFDGQFDARLVADQVAQLYFEVLTDRKRAH